MQRDRRLFTGKASRTRAGKEHEPPDPPNGVELQISEHCPKNFVIFDKTKNKSQIMFHPALAQKFSSSSFSASAISAHDNQEGFPSTKEDAEDIDVLLSLEEDEDEDDDTVSTGRTLGNWGGSYPDSSCSSDFQKSHNFKSASAHKPCYGGGSSSSSTGESKNKRERTRKMVRALKGIVPGGERMDTPAVLDEAVRYLKSLKMEVRNLGIKDFNN